MFKVHLVKSCTGEYEDYSETIIKGFIDKNKAEEFLKSCEDYFKNQFDTIEVEDEDYFAEEGDYYDEPLYRNEEYINNSPCGMIYIDYNGVWFSLEEVEIEE